MAAILDGAGNPIEDGAGNPIYDGAGAPAASADVPYVISANTGFF